MKKLIAVPVILIILIIAGIYFFIPGTLTITSAVITHCSISGVNRTLQQKSNWKKFWPGSTHFTPAPVFGNDDFLLYNNDTFRITLISQNALTIRITDDKTNTISTLLFLPLPQDSIALRWNYTKAASSNPFIGIQQYRQAVQTKENMTAALNTMSRFLSKNENIYGFAITQTTTKDTFFVSTKSILDTSPSTEQVYSLIKKLQAYIKLSNAAPAGNPIMNITQLDKQQYQLMVAVPTNKQLGESGDISYKRMVPGRFLTATVTGGQATINRAYSQLQQYFQDYRRTAMAIPFMYLVTDRSQESDTSKWVTKLYFPVM